MKKFFTIGLLIAGITYGCAPKVKTSVTKTHEPLGYQEEVYVYQIDDIKPASGEVLGTVKVGDAGMTTRCSYGVVLAEAQTAARKMGGNAIHITAHKTPDFMSSCHRITAEVLKVERSELALLDTAEEIDTTLDYATLYVYRGGGQGSLVSYNVYLGDSVICRVSNKSKQVIKISKSLKTELWAKTESKESVPIDIVPGKKYYLRCGVRMGVMVGRPSLELVAAKYGKVEYERTKGKLK